MTIKKSTKRALLMSALSLLMCVSMLVGSTFAWFTDSVTSAGNIIKSGTLDVEMHWAEGKLDPNADTTTWTDASTGAIFNHDKWEPGYTEVRHIKIANEGTLALKYQLNIIANGEVSELADVIDVYYVDPAVQVADRTALTDANKLGTLTQVLDNISTTASGNLKAGEKDTITLALKMQESAGNEYQNLAIGSDFSIQLLATQLTSENDSFDDQYDVNAPKTEVATAAELQKVLNEGGYALLANDIAVEGNKRIDVPAGTYAVLDLNGHTLTSKDGGGSNTMAIYIDKGAVLTLNDTAGGGEIVSSCYGVYVKQNAKFIMNGGKLSVSGNGVYDMGVVVYNGAFVMNGGTIDSKFGVWASNYYRDNGETGLNDCSVKIADGCTLNSTGYADVEFADALDTVLDIPEALTTYPVLVDTSAELKNAVLNGGMVMLADDIVMDETISVTDADFELYGKGHTITMSDTCVNTYALFDITRGKATIKDVTFDGIKEGAIVRTVGGVEFNADNVTAVNGNHTQVQGIFRLLGKSTITNCTFKNNTCNMVISLNYDGANNDPQVVKNCVFENNTCNATGVLYYVKGASCTLDGNKFVGNTVNCNGNGATVYMGFTENNTITNNVFKNNVVKDASTSKRVAGALMVGYETVITNNAFIDNKVEGTNAKGNDVCASVYYTDIDLSGNYWGGEAPVENDNYFVEYPDNYNVIINDYLTTYSN